MSSNSTSEVRSRIQSGLNAIRSSSDFVPEVGLILGSGLGPLANQMEVQASFAYENLPGFPVSTAPGHVGRLVLGLLEGKRVVAFQGRVHLYEGYSAQEVAIPVHLAKALGAQVMVLTNACGGLNPSWQAGEIMLQTDFINFTGVNPLTGPNDSGLGVRFVPMMDAYDHSLCELARQTARGQDLVLREGTYLGIAGPCYAPKAELRMFRSWGADAIGMSTVLELIAARHLGLRVVGLSTITDMAVADQGDHSGTSEQAVIDKAKETAPRFERLLRAILARI